MIGRLKINNKPKHIAGPTPHKVQFLCVSGWFIYSQECILSVQAMQRAIKYWLQGFIIKMIGLILFYKGWKCPKMQITEKYASFISLTIYLLVLCIPVIVFINIYATIFGFEDFWSHFSHVFRNIFFKSCEIFCCYIENIKNIFNIYKMYSIYIEILIENIFSIAKHMGFFLWASCSCKRWKFAFRLWAVSKSAFHIHRDTSESVSD